MRYTLFAMAGLLAFLVGFWMMSRRRLSPRIHTVHTQKSGEPRYLTPQAQLVKLKESDMFWGYRIESHCTASSRLAGRQYEKDELPPLPVDGCSSRHCECRLIGLADHRSLVDRRTGQDRRHSLRMDCEDRRDDRPRRKADLNSWVSYSHL